MIVSWKAGKVYFQNTIYLRCFMKSGTILALGQLVIYGKLFDIPTANYINNLSSNIL